MRSKLAVTPVKQETDAICTLACLESVAKDLGLDWTQQKIAEAFRYETYADRQDEQPIGAVTLRHLPSLVLGLGLAQDLRFGTGIESLEEMAPVLEKKDGFLILVFYYGSRYDPIAADVTRPGAEEKVHAVRLIEIVPRDRIVVMDPSPLASREPVQLQWNVFVGRALHVIAGWTKPHLW